jgi:hypothetical protein
MKRFILLILLLSYMAFGQSFATPNCPHFSWQEPQSRFTFDTHIPNIVQILTNCSSCTGFVVGKNRFITAAHCFEGHGLTKIHAVFFNGYKTELTLIKRGSRFTRDDEDVAVLSGDTGNISPFSISNQCRKPESIIECGYGINHVQKCTLGFGGRKDRQYPSGMYTFKGHAEYGDSGGPVINEEGRVVGMITQLAVGGSDTFFCVPSSKLLEYLK